MTLTGMETWAIIAPILAAEMVTKHDITQDAYIITFGALKAYDKPKRAAEKPEITLTEALRVVADYLNAHRDMDLIATYRENVVQLSLEHKSTLQRDGLMEATK